MASPFVATQIYVPIKRNDIHMNNLLKCLDDIKAWMALTFLYLNDKKTEGMFSGPSPVDLGFGPLY